MSAVTSTGVLWHGFFRGDVYPYRGALLRFDGNASFGGVFSVIYPEVSQAMMQAKVRNIEASGADTVVACGRRILPKAETEDQARKCLKILSGRRHRVWGGIAVVTPEGKSAVRLVCTTVAFKQLTESEIAGYIASGEWHGKAGGYAIQGCAAALIPWIAGSYSNVVGLPLYETAQLIEKLDAQRERRPPL